MSCGDHPTVIAVAGRDTVDEGRQLAELLCFLKRRGVIAEYGQVALLLHSVQEPVARPYLDALESAGRRGGQTTTGRGAGTAGRSP